MLSFVQSTMSSVYVTFPSSGLASVKVDAPAGVVLESQVPKLYWQSGSAQYVPPTPQ
jgi:hypothetical protein